MKKIIRKFLKFIPDNIYLKLKYFYIFHKRLNLKEPKTFNEKLNWLKLNDRKDIYTTLVDKFEVKKYVSDIIGDKFIIPTIGIYERIEDIDFEKLPNKFVIKCTHDSGGLVICKDKRKLDFDLLKNKINKCLKVNYYYHAREWPYKNVKPRIIIEKYMGDNLKDYKFFCFNGEPKIILVCSNRNGNHKNTNFYDSDWNLLPFTRSRHKNSPNKIEKPKRLEKMIDIAKKLSKDIAFVRVDLYNIEDEIFFGEITFTPSGGFEGFEPNEWDSTLGEWIDLKKVK